MYIMYSYLQISRFCAALASVAQRSEFEAIVSVVSPTGAGDIQRRGRSHGHGSNATAHAARASLVSVSEVK